MDYIWTPWRYHYVSSVDKVAGCPFCRKLAAGDDRENLIVHRATYNFVILNLYPYTSGHVMVVPYEHLDSLAKLSPEAAAEMMYVTQRLEGILRKLYEPDGVNIGMNLGRAAGAGIAGHVHMHVLPRWIGDTGFIATVAETRVLPEDLAITWERLKEAFA
ncbi:MAG TPA: HIT domain-containing protein [Terriglobales bacterium]|nr:HIT domain-containing protein [Terriglobales bacterium]